MQKPNTITEHVDGFRRQLTIKPAYDKRHSDPAKNYGIHGVEMRFVLLGSAGATQWVFYTGMHLPHARASIPVSFSEPMGADLGYHASKPQYEGQEPMGECDLIEGGTCYYDGSALRAAELVGPFLSEGPDAVWSRLREEYRRRFEVGE